jgi:hypothetical protein
MVGWYDDMGEVRFKGLSRTAGVTERGIPYTCISHWVYLTDAQETLERVLAIQGNPVEQEELPEC